MTKSRYLELLRLPMCSFAINATPEEYAFIIDNISKPLCRIAFDEENTDVKPSNVPEGCKC